MVEQDPEQVKRVHKIRLEVAEAIFGKMLELTKKDDATREHFEKASMLANMWKTMSEGRIVTSEVVEIGEPIHGELLQSEPREGITIWDVTKLSRAQLGTLFAACCSDEQLHEEYVRRGLGEPKNATT